MNRDKERIVIQAQPVGFVESLKLKRKGASEAGRNAIEVDVETMIASSATIMGLVSETYHSIGMERRRFITESSTLNEKITASENDLARIESNHKIDTSEKWLKLKRIRTEIEHCRNELEKLHADHNEIIFIHHEILYRKFSIYWQAALKKDSSLPAQPGIYVPLVHKEEWIRSKYLKEGTDNVMEGKNNVENF